MTSKKKKENDYGKKNFMDVINQDASKNPFFGNVKDQYDKPPIQQINPSWLGAQGLNEGNTLNQAQSFKATSNKPKSDISNRIDQYLSPSNVNSYPDRTQFSNVSPSTPQRIVAQPPSSNSLVDPSRSAPIEPLHPPASTLSHNQHPPKISPNFYYSDDALTPLPPRPRSIQTTQSLPTPPSTPLPSRPHSIQTTQSLPTPPSTPINCPPAAPANPRSAMMSELKEKLRKRQC